MDWNIDMANVFLKVSYTIYSSFNVAVSFCVHA